MEDAVWHVPATVVSKQIFIIVVERVIPFDTPIVLFYILCSGTNTLVKY
jgi:hypothetical protein